MAQQTRTFIDRLFLVLKGLAMGAANKVPGVSGGVVAYVAGFYEEFIASLQKFNLKALKLLLNGRFASFWRYVNGNFLGLLILGMLISYFSVSILLDIALMHYPLWVWSAFFGMIIGSIYYISKDFGRWTKKNFAFLLLGAIAGVAISLLKPAVQNDALWFVFLCGVIGVSGMTLPGLSGSFILILLGNYVLLLVDAVNALYTAIIEMLSGDFSFIQDPEHIRMLKVLGVFSAGSLTGLLTLSHFLGYLLKHFKKATDATIIGFITGSLGVVWPWKKEIFETDALGNLVLDANQNPILQNFGRYLPTEFNFENVLAVVFIILGILLVIALGKYGDAQKTPKSA